VTHEPAPAFKHTSGPRTAKIVIVGEAWGESEDMMKKPFVGESGKELFRMLGEATIGGQPAPELHAAACALHKYGLAWVKEREAWLDAASIMMTNVLALRPPDNKLDYLCLTKDELPHGYSLPPIAKSGSKQLFLHPDLLGELTRLEEELTTVRPNLIVALGNPACWATLRTTAITSIRGTIAQGIENIKVLPTFHPAGVMRNWAWRPIVVADLIKALREAQFPEIIRPQRTIIINPSIEELEEWTELTLATATALSCDTETELGQIKMISFAPTVDHAMVVPFLDWSKPGGSYWPTEELEFRAWVCVRRLLESPIPKLWQNGMYDLQYTIRRKIWPQRCEFDPMLLHHSIFPEMNKGLGFLGSIYTNEASWKLMRKQKTDTEKRDE
jgi:uracil-DNA glycosylase